MFMRRSCGPFYKHVEYQADSRCLKYACKRQERSLSVFSSDGEVMELIELIVVLRNTLSALLTTSSSWFLNSINHGLFLSTTVPQAIGRFTTPFPHSRGLVAQSAPGSLTPLFVCFWELYAAFNYGSPVVFHRSYPTWNIQWSKWTKSKFFIELPTLERGTEYDCSLNW